MIAKDLGYFDQKIYTGLDEQLGITIRQMRVFQKMLLIQSNIQHLKSGNPSTVPPHSGNHLTLHHQYNAERSQAFPDTDCGICEEISD